MPLHGKIVVIKRSGGDGTEFPLTATCLFGRKPDCDIRIQLPQVSKEHCRIDLNENKEVILTNLSSVNPTRVNGEALQQSERLKHGDVITVIDRSFRFEYPPAPTPKKKSSVGAKTESFKVLQDQQVGDTVTSEKGEKRISAVSSDPHLKDGTNHDNIQRSLEKTVELESKEDDSLLQNKTTSPFNDLYQMIKKSLDVKTPLKSSASLLQTPPSKFCTPKPLSVQKDVGNSVISTEDKSTPKRDETRISSGALETENISKGTPKSVKRRKKSFHISFNEMAGPETENVVKCEAASPQRRNRATPQRFTVCEVIEQVSPQTLKSPTRRRSKEATPTKPAVTKEQETSTKKQPLRRASPRNSGKVETVKESSKKRKSGELAADLPAQQMKKKRVSFGGHLSPEFFDKRLPPDSPLRKGGTPRRSLCLFKPKQSLLRRASVIGLLQEHPDIQTVQSPAKMRTLSPKKSSSAHNASPKTLSPGMKSPKSRSPSPKGASPVKKFPKSRTPSPKKATPGKKSPKSRTPSPKGATPGMKSPKSRSPSPKKATPGKKSPKSRSPSPKKATPGKKSPKSRSPSPKKATPGKKSPKSRSPSPKKATPGKKSPKSRSPSPKGATPGKKSPKSRSPSPKGATPGKTSPKSRSPSPKGAIPRKTSPKSRTPSPKGATPRKTLPKSRTPSSKGATPGMKSPKSKSPSRAIGRSPSQNKVETPGVQTPIVQGRFSVSHISTPSPTAENADTVTLKLPLRRKSMKITSRKTPSMARSAVKVMCRRSGISRASMKAKNSWADIVKFGQIKAEVVHPAKQRVTKKLKKKKAMPKPQTPARKLKDHVTTGHAASPVTIVVGRAHKQKVVHATGAAPKLVTNTALLKKDMKMDEDLTGISEMYKTPLNERKRKSFNDKNMKTPVEGLGTSLVEPSMLNTPEEPGEMMVSPLSVSSPVKERLFDSEAVECLFTEDQESSSSEHQSTDLKMTPELKPELPDCLTGVKRVMKTPRQKAEPVEDLRGKILKTPKQKVEQQECLTGVKRIMKTPKRKAEPVEDLRGKILKTPKQKVEQQECFTGVKRIMKTPKQKAEPVEDLRGKILKTPKQKLEPQDCLTGVKRIFSTPQQETKPLEDLQEKLLEIPKALEARDASSDDVKENEETPALKQESEDLSAMMDVKNSPLLCLADIERKLKTSVEKGTPVDDLIGKKRLRKTPREKTEPVEENFGIKRLMKSPRPRVNEPVEDFEGLKELMEEPMPNPTGQLDSNEVEDQTLDCGVDAVKELDFTHEEPQNNVPSDVIDNVGIEKEAIKEVAADDHLGQVPCEHESSNASEPVSQAVVDDNLSVEETKANAADANLSKEKPQVENTTDKVSEIESPSVSEHDKKAVPGTKVVETESAEDKQNAPEHSEDAIIPVSVRGRRGKKTEATAPPAVRQTTRRRNAKTAESIDFEVAMEKSAPLSPKVALKPKRGRNLKKASDVQVEMVQGVPDETERVREPATDPSPSGDVGQEENDAAHLEHAVVKPKRGRKAKQPDQLVPEQVDVPCSHSDDLHQTDEAKDSNKLCSDQLVVGPSRSSEKKSSNAMETAPQTSVTQSLNEGEAGIQDITKLGTAIVQKKSGRGRRAKVVESKSPEDKPEVTQHSENPVLASVRGRRGKKTEAAVPPVRQTMRSRNVKSQPSTPDQPEIILQKDVQTELVTEITTSPINAHQEQNDCAPNAEDAVVKPSRGRKTKQTPVQPPQPKPEKKEFVSEEHLTEDTLPQKSIPTLGKPRRGRTTKMDIAEQNEVSEETVVAVEINQQPEPPVRAKRGRKAKQEEEKMENNGKDNSVDTTKSQDPIKLRNRTAEQDCVDPRVQTSEIIVPEETEAPLAEPLKMMEQADVTAKPRRGGRKAKQDTKSETLVKSTEVQQIPANSWTDKPQQSRRGQRVADKVEVTSVLQEEKTDSEAEEKKNSEPDAPASKPTRGRRVKNDVSLAIPAKRARRGAVLPLVETNADSADLVTELASTSVQPPKRGRRAATKPTADDVTVTIDQATPTEDFQSIAEDTKMSKRSVKWKTGIEVFEIQKLTPVKAVRGRKSKIGDQVDTERPIVSKDASKTEEMDLSDKVVGAQPAKRARRGAKLADVTADKDESTSKGKNVEAETRPQTRRGRSAKK